MTYPTGPKGGSDPAVTRGVLVLIVAALIGIVLLAGSGSFTAKNASTKKATTTVPISAVTTAATSTTTAVPTTKPVAEVKVLVLNATGGIQTNAGSSFTAKLKPAGYQMQPTDDASSALDKSVVYFATGYQPDAQAVAKLLGLPDTAVAVIPAQLPSQGAGNANVVAMIGKDLATPSGPPATGGTATGGTATGGTATGGTATGGTTTRGTTGAATGGTTTRGTTGAATGGTTTRGTTGAATTGGTTTRGTTGAATTGGTTTRGTTGAATTGGTTSGGTTTRSTTGGVSPTTHR